MPRRFWIGPFALNKYRILHIKNLTSNKKIGYQDFNEHTANKFLKYEIKNGVRDVNFKI